MRNILNSTIIKNAILLVVIIGSLTNCTAGFEEANDPKENINKEILSRDNYTVGSALVNLQNIAFPEQENLYQMNYDLIGNYLGRYYTYANNGFSNKNHQRFNHPGWAASPFNDVIFRVQNGVKEVENSSEPSSLAYQWAQVLRVACYIFVTDVYGPVPLGLNPEKPKVYNSQKEIYEACFKILDEAIATIKGFTSDKSARYFVENDHVYGGDFSKWVKFASSLKLRMAIRIRFVEPELAKKYAEEAVQSGVLTENDENTTIEYVPNGNFKMTVDWGDSRMCADMDSYMNGYKDPRLEKYFLDAKTVGDRLYIGCLAGAIIGNKTIADDIYSAGNFTRESKGIWMTAAEMYFCRAEGALLGWDMGGTPEMLYNKGIMTSFDQWKVEGANEYIANDTDKPMDYKDAAGGYGKSESATTDITIKWNDGDSMDKKLERIIVQKWIAMYPLGQEAWNDIRRTGYPKIFPPASSTNGFNLLVPNRMPYPEAQKTTNQENYNYALTLLGGEDTYGTKLWWQK